MRTWTYLESTARRTAVRLKLTGMWRVNSAHPVAGHSKELDAWLGGLPLTVCDWMPAQPLIERKYDVLIHSRESWENPDDQPYPLTDECWFSDGSKNEFSSGAGIYRPDPEVALCYNLGPDASVFQAEVFAITRCAEYALNSDAQSTTICSDSQAALKAITSREVVSSAVRECIDTLNALAARSAVRLVWVPGHRGIGGNERADELARAGAEEPFVGPAPVIPIPLRTLISSVHDWAYQESLMAWRLAPGCAISKALLPSPSTSFTSKLLDLCPDDLAVVVGLLTGHTRLNHHLNKIGIRSEPDCDCGHIKEDALHFLCDCPRFTLQRLRVYDSMFCTVDTINSAGPLALLRFAKATGRFSRRT